MTYGTDADYEKLAEMELPVVICARSNRFFNNLPNIPKMIDSGVKIVLGSDNAMLNTPNMFEELSAGYEIANKFGRINPKNMLEMITVNLKKILNPKDYISLAPGTQSNFMVLDIPEAEPVNSLVKGISIDKIKLINIGTTVWKR
jgi:cytosine/adenosine deaminase-related metal-dependent hydrolase